MSIFSLALSYAADPCRVPRDAAWHWYEGGKLEPDTCPQCGNPNEFFINLNGKLSRIPIYCGCSDMIPTCRWCGSHAADDARGNCGACGGPREEVVRSAYAGMVDWRI